MSIDEMYFKGKKIKCSWCLNFGTSFCSKKSTKVRANKKRRCEDFMPDETALKKEADKGKDVKVTRRPDWYWLSKSEIKKLKEQKKQELAKAIKQDSSHPLTGDLSRFRTTAD